MRRWINEYLKQARRRKFVSLAVLMFVVLGSAAGVWAMLTGGGYTLYPSKVTYGGGVNSIGGGYSLSGAVGEASGTSLTGGGYISQGGIWQIIAAQNANVEPTPTDEPTPPPGACPAPPAGAPPLRPLVSFPRPQEDGQYRIILWNAGYQLIMFDIVESLSAICDTTTCTITPDAQLLPFGLINGNHSVYVQRLPVGVWQEAASFEITHPAPALVSSINTAPNQGRPTITWTADYNVLYFQVLIASSAGEIAYLNWHERTPEMCCGTTCMLKPQAYPPGGNYTVYIQAWGPGGFSPGGLANQGWVGGTSFALPATPPQIVTNLTTANESTGNPTFMWTGSEGVTWYQFWMGTLSPLNTMLMDWYLAEDLGCENAGPCSLTTTALNLPQSTYNWYVRGWGPGGFASGGIEGWAEGNEFVVGP